MTFHNDYHHNHLRIPEHSSVPQVPRIGPESAGTMYVPSGHQTKQRIMYSCYGIID